MLERKRQTGKRQSKVSNYYLQQCMPFVCLVLVRLFSALQNGGLAPHEWIAAKGLLPNFPSAYNACHLTKTGLKRLGALFLQSRHRRRLFPRAPYCEDQ